MSKKIINVEVGSRIRIARERAGLTQEELAERIGRSTQFISTIERGAAGPSLETVVRLCEVLHTTAEWLLRGLQPAGDTIALKMSALSMSQLRIVDNMADSLLELLEVTRTEK